MWCLLPDCVFSWSAVYSFIVHQLRRTAGKEILYIIEKILSDLYLHMSDLTLHTPLCSPQSSPQTHLMLISFISSRHQSSHMPSLKLHSFGNHRASLLTRQPVRVASWNLRGVISGVCSSVDQSRFEQRQVMDSVRS